MCISLEYNINITEIYKYRSSDPGRNIFSMEWYLSLLELYNIYALFREKCSIFPARLTDI
jgi:hypothetical protein